MGWMVIFDSLRRDEWWVLMGYTGIIIGVYQKYYGNESCDIQENHLTNMRIFWWHCGTSERKHLSNKYGHIMEKMAYYWDINKNLQSFESGMWLWVNSCGKLAWVITHIDTAIPQLGIHHISLDYYLLSTHLPNIKQFALEAMTHFDWVFAQQDNEDFPKQTLKANS